MKHRPITQVLDYGMMELFNPRKLEKSSGLVCSFPRMESRKRVDSEFSACDEMDQ